MLFIWWHVPNVGCNMWAAQHALWKNKFDADVRCSGFCVGTSFCSFRTFQIGTLGMSLCNGSHWNGKGYPPCACNPQQRDILDVSITNIPALMALIPDRILLLVTNVVTFVCIYTSLFFHWMFCILNIFSCLIFSTFLMQIFVLCIWLVITNYLRLSSVHVFCMTKYLFSGPKRVIWLPSLYSCYVPPAVIWMGHISRLRDAGSPCFLHPLDWSFLPALCSTFAGQNIQ